jgi:hypothetical protein
MQQNVAEWIVVGLVSDPTVIGYVVPVGFSHYVRLLHPSLVEGRAVRWSELAASAGTDVSAETQFSDIANGAKRPCDGSLSPKEFGELIAVLQSEPTQATALRWMGYENPHGVPPDVHAVIQGERYTGSNASTNRFMGWYTKPLPFDDSFQGPNYVWATDRSWLIVTDIDLVSTYVATQTSIIAELARTSLEFVRVGLSDPLI